ncbi:hypothetical protein IW262DRAFT_1294735 [Armillaria fumosa]|nr:hypothetical protein IW262DRAFT_1294735 [Armillaria fumosa]
MAVPPTESISRVIAVEEYSSLLSLKDEISVSLYGGYYINTAINYIACTIVNAVHLSGNPVVERSLDGDNTYAQKDEYNFTIIQATTEEELTQFENIQVCPDKDEEFSVLIFEAEQLGQPSRLDTTRIQEGYRCHGGRRLKMFSARVGYDLFFAGFIAIAVQLGELRYHGWIK